MSLLGAVVAAVWVALTVWLAGPDHLELAPAPLPVVAENDPTGGGDYYGHRLPVVEGAWL